MRPLRKLIHLLGPWRGLKAWFRPKPKDLPTPPVETYTINDVADVFGKIDLETDLGVPFLDLLRKHKGCPQGTRFEWAPTQDGDDTAEFPPMEDDFIQIDSGEVFSSEMFRKSRCEETKEEVK